MSVIMERTVLVICLSRVKNVKSEISETIFPLVGYKFAETYVFLKELVEIKNDFVFKKIMDII